MLEGKKILILGGAGRLGAAFVKSIVKNNGIVFIGDINKKECQKIQNQFGADKVSFYCGNLTEDKNLNKLISLAIDKFGKIDAAVNCAYPKSPQWGKKFEELEPSHLKEDLFNHLGIAILFAQKILKVFSDQSFGHLIHISSIQGIRTPKFEHYEKTRMTSPIEYTAVKSGLISITSYLAKYYRMKGIRVNCISPGGLEDNQPEVFLNRYRRSCNSKGMLDPHDISGALLFLLKEDSKYMNGQNIIVDDGWSN